MSDKLPKSKRDSRRRADAIEQTFDAPEDAAVEAAIDGEGFSLDDLGAAYAQALAEHDPEAFANRVVDPSSSQASAAESGDLADEFAASNDSDPADNYVSPIAIIEAALFVGHPDNQPLSEMRLASLMRDVTPDEVVELIDQLNDSYRQHRQALRVIREDNGYRMTIAPEVETVRRSFLGKVREARLNQSAVEVLALVAYQPGITSQKVQDQRGRESASLLNQLVRRRLLEIRRLPADDSPKVVPRYFPTERFLYLFGLESLEDLPHVEEATQE